MDMKHLLSCCLTVSQEKVDSFTGDATAPQGCRDSLCHTKEMNTVVFVHISQEGGVGVWDDEDMTRVDGLNIHEGRAAVVLMHGA
jgi:hypothetical protein